MEVKRTETDPRSVAEIQIVGRRWFQRSYGNTYHTATVKIVLSDGESHTWKSGETYGYDSQYETTALELLDAHGFMREYDRRKHGPLSLYCRENGIRLDSFAIDVQRERDL